MHSDKPKPQRKKLPATTPVALEALGKGKGPAADDKGDDDFGVIENLQDDFLSTGKFWDLSPLQEVHHEQAEEEPNDYVDGDADACKSTLYLTPNQSSQMVERGTIDFVQLFNRTLQSSGLDLNLGLDLLSQPRDNEALKEVIHAIHSCQHGLSDQLKTVHLMPRLSQSHGHANIHNTLPFPRNPSIHLRGSWLWLKEYAFLDCAALERLEPVDLAYLRESGALHLPSRDVINVFVKEYFLHVHPMLPLLEERSFWKALNCISEDGGRSDFKGISLFLFQAVLAASSIVSAFEPHPFPDLPACVNIVFSDLLRGNPG